MMKHTLRYTLLLFFALGIVCFIGLTMSTPGLKTALYIVQKMTPGELKISGVEGSFSKGISIAQLSYAVDKTHININNLNLKTQPLALLSAELHVTELSIDTLTIIPAPMTKNAVPLTHLAWHLPLSVALKNIHINHIVYQKNNQALLINNVLLDGFISSNKISLDQLQFTHNQLIYTAKGDVSVKPIIITLNLSISDLQKQAKFAIALNTTGDWQKLNVQGNISLPLQFKFNSQIVNVLNNPQWDLPKWNLIGIITRIDSRVLMTHLDSKLYQGTINAHGTLQQLMLDAELAPIKNSGKQTLKLHLASTDLKQLLFDAHLQWQNLAWPLAGTAAYSSSAGDIQLIGSPEKYTYTASFDLQGDNVPVGDWKFSGTGNKDQVQLSRFNLLTLGGKVNGTGYFKWKAPLDYQLNLTAMQLNPDHQWTDWTGNLNFALNVKGSAANLALQFSNLNGLLREQIINGKLALNIVHKKLVDINANLNYGAAKLLIHATREPDLNVQWNIHIPDLAKLTPFGNGSLETQGEISRLATRPKIKGYISGSNLAWLNYQANKLTADFDIDADLAHNSTLTIEGNDVKINQFSFQDMTINLNGKPQNFKLYAGTVVNDNVITLSATGNYLNNQWHSIFQQLDWKTPENTHWNLTAPFTLNIDPQQLQIEHFDWRAPQQSIQLDMNWLFSTLPVGRLIMNNIALDNFDQFLTNEITAQGRLDLNITNTDTPKTTLLTIDMKSKQAKLFYYETQEDATQKMVLIKDFTAKLYANPKALAVNINMNINQNDYFHFNFNLPHYDIRHPINKNQAVSGDLAAQFNTLNFLAFFPNLHNISGQLLTHLTWNGTLLAPHPVGDLELRNGAVSEIESNLNLKNIYLKVHADPTQKIQYKLSMNSGDGSLMVKGTTDYSQTSYPTSLHITGQNFLFLNTSNYKIVASPNLTFTKNNQRVDLKGSIDVPEASIHYRVNNNIISLPSDVVVNSSTALDESGPFWNEFYANINLTLGKNIKISLEHLNAQLTGHLTLRDSPKTPTLATGELTVLTGSYSAFGQTLTINNGKLMYAGGSVDNPGLLLKATKTIQTYVNPLASALNSTSSNSVVNITPQEKIIVVGISVTNNLNDPVLTLFSDQPSLTKADILSYLVLGYPLNQASNQQGQTLVQAASALNLGEGQSTVVLKDLKNTFELDQVGLQASNYLNPTNNSVQQNTSLVLGKMFSPRLFVSYSIGLLAPINTITASYALTSNFSTQTSSNNLGSGIDFIYSFEHN